MLLIVSPSSVRQPAKLSARNVPKRLLDLGITLFPRGERPRGIFLRTILEKSLPRYIVALTPFPILLWLNPDTAFGMSQAPLLMAGVVLLVETYVLAIPSKEARRKLIDKAEAERSLDRFRLRGTEILSAIAARRGMTAGTLHLVVEQSGLARIPPLTYASVQAEGDGPDMARGFLDLDAEERALIADRLFDADLPEKLLHRVNLSEHRFLRSVAFDAASVSAHARLAAMGAR